MLEQGDVAAAALPEVEVGADHHDPRAAASTSTSRTKSSAVSDRALGVEAQHEAAIEIPGGVEELELLLEGVEHLRRRLRAHHFGGMAVEGHAHRVEPARVRELAHES